MTYYKPRHTVGIAIPKEMHEKLKRIAIKKRCSVSALIRKLVNKYIR